MTERENRLSISMHEEEKSIDEDSNDSTDRMSTGSNS